MLKIRTEQVLPLVLILLNVVTAAIYASKGDVRKTIYWAASATLMSVLTF